METFKDPEKLKHYDYTMLMWHHIYHSYHIAPQRITARCVLRHSLHFQDPEKLKKLVSLYAESSAARQRRRAAPAPLASWAAAPARARLSWGWAPATNDLVLGRAGCCFCLGRRADLPPKPRQALVAQASFREPHRCTRRGARGACGLLMT